MATGGSSFKELIYLNRAAPEIQNPSESNPVGDRIGYRIILHGKKDTAKQEDIRITSQHTLPPQQSIWNDSITTY
jgi:hypothetical protein